MSPPTCSLQNSLFSEWTALPVIFIPFIFVLFCFLPDKWVTKYLTQELDQCLLLHTGALWNWWKQMVLTKEINLKHFVPRCVAALKSYAKIIRIYWQSEQLFLNENKHRTSLKVIHILMCKNISKSVICSNEKLMIW